MVYAASAAPTRWPRWARLPTYRTPGPQHATTVVFTDTRVAPINSTVIGAENYSANMTGTLSTQGATIPPRSSYPGVQGQILIDPTLSTGAMYYCTTDNNWIKTPLSWATF